MLLRLDSLLTTGQPFYDHAVITVEHVLPQTPKEGSKWLEYFDDPSQYVHKLGNLVLLTRVKNSQARNYDFQKEKKESYFQPKKWCEYLRFNKSSYSGKRSGPLKY
ncbi:hypothetical protein GCM10020331_073760 [Ectobacillus funiculus]